MTRISPGGDKVETVYDKENYPLITQNPWDTMGLVQTSLYF
jgi:hypothetical protein